MGFDQNHFIFRLLGSQHVVICHVIYSDFLLMSLSHNIPIFPKQANIGAVFLPTVYDSINYKENLDKNCLVRDKCDKKAIALINMQLHNIGDMFKPIACLSKKNKGEVHPTCP
jgi:hypothetical protein